jgi:sialic acid synthase SpsE
MEEHLVIKRYCDELEVPFMATAHDFEAVDFLVDIGSAAIKVASPDIVHYPLLRHIARHGVPVFLDTGASYLDEIQRAVEVLREAGQREIVVNHNPAGHPSPADRHDLRTIPHLQRLLELPVGLADHYEGYEMLYAAVALGAHTMEKPISRDRTVPEPERNWSVSIDELEHVIRSVEGVYRALGKADRQMTEAQEAYRENNRVACVAASDLPAGTELTLRHVVFGRPRKGIGAEHWDAIEGRKLQKPKKQHQFLQWEDLG